MKKILWSAAAVLMLGGMLSCSSSKNIATQPRDNKLVILHVNDTHSQIEPGGDGLGGIIRRKGVIDSIRGSRENVLVVDAGDAVQGTLFFYVYGGEVEEKMLNALGVEAQVLGNHEFDRGMENLGKIMRISNAAKLSANYDFTGTPLEGVFVPYIVKEYQGKKIGILGINLKPDGMILPENSKGVKFNPIVESANKTAAILRDKEGVDAVIALTHIGYAPAGQVGDSILAQNSRGIDIIIGGHSHDLIDPAKSTGQARSRMRNADGKDILVVQTGKSGRYLGQIELNLDSIGTSKPSYKLIKMDSKFDKYHYPELEKAIDGYRAGVDSLMQKWVGTSARLLNDKDPELLNFFTDFIFRQGQGIADNVDMAIGNKGGLRTPIPEGKFSEGHVINLIPFDNYVTVLEIKGSDLLDVFNVMALTDGNGVSKNVKVKYVPGKDAHVTEVLINGKALDPNATYRVATIDYLAKGGDYMTGLKNGKKVADDDKPLNKALIHYLTKGEGVGKNIGGDAAPRWSVSK